MVNFVLTLLGLALLLFVVKGLFLTLTLPVDAIRKTRRGMSDALGSVEGRLIVLLALVGLLFAYAMQPPIHYKLWESAEWQTEVIESTHIDGILMGIHRRYRNQGKTEALLRQNARTLSQQMQQLSRQQRGNRCVSSISKSQQLVFQLCVEQKVVRFEVTYPKAPALAKGE